MVEDDVASRKTYRYLRIGIVGAVVLLGASVLVERSKVAPGCWQTSISAYYYTPARAVFVGALMAIGLSLIVIKGNTGWEDVLLNVAGMLAPVVALVPIGNPGTCWSIEPSPLPTLRNPATGDLELAAWVERNIENNIQALLWAGAAALLAAAVIAAVAFAVGARRGEQRTLADLPRGPHRGTFLSLVAALAFLVAGAALFATWDRFEENAHGLAAYAMFGCLAAAAALNALECRKFGLRWYVRLYGGIAVLMGAAALLILVKNWDHKTLVVEIVQIGLFAGFWIVQTRELWHTTVRSAPTAG
ncbi:MAG TPA: hypothetical protein VM388_11125 [Acidimicrobiales bacterium]|nr:hypothetical protein [Acidimicrobiales bacterium]